MEKYNSEDFLNVGDENADGYDAVVIGSGYGGSVAAFRMSLAGLKVCLLEKGRKYEAQDFPTDSYKIWSAVRMENKNLGFNFGPKDALFQVHIQDDAVAATACGLGGGSLVNAGVMLPTPIRARRDPKWPKDWEKDWERYEASASEMLRIQSSPMKFQNVKIMEKVIEKEYDHSPLKLSIDFDKEKVSNSQENGNGSCLACGNCLSGCPYNAKNSTDKTYLASAIQEGCTIRTESEVQYVVRNEGGIGKAGSKRRWLVFLNEFDYVASDIVVLSAGVMGTTKILFQSQLRGLRVSQKLGSGLSCNGNNVAYVAGSSAPLNASGLHKKQFSSIPFHERPGPSISSSYTSSLGFTIQSAVIPAAYPRFLFKGITTYKSQSGYGFLHDISDRLKQVIGLKRSEEMVLNAMGYDDSDGKLTFEKSMNKIFFQPPNDPLLPKKVEAFLKLTKKLGGVLFMSKYRSTSVHLLGGCIVSSDFSSGVCNNKGQVFNNKSPSGVHTGLYICDASIIPCSIGVNPSLTIAAAAEHVSKHLIQDSLNENRYRDQKPGLILNGKIKKSSNSEVMFEETMRGEIGGLPCTAYLKLRLKSLPFYDKTHPFIQGKVGGYIVCRAIEMDKMYIIHGEVNLCEIDVKTPYTQYMHYHLILAASSGSRYVLEGRKILNPYLLGLYAWRESTTIHVTLREINNNAGQNTMMNLKGKLHISPLDFLKAICSLKGGTRSEFICHFIQSLFKTYILQVPRGSQDNFTPMELVHRPYPNSTIHEIKTEDGFTIYCQHWECSQLKLKMKTYPVFLINGYATESYCLPTEPNDLVRTLLKEEHDVWLLRARLHISNPPNNFSIEDIGRIDIPAAIDKVNEFYGDRFSKVHVVAHCVGGLAIHIAIMGGHVSAKKISSLSCTNSSMFFKLNTSSLVKMWLPLIPMSMAILGKNKTLPMFQTSITTLRHRLLKSIARLIPRHERCICDECEVFSGIFGNAFWHENISQTMHYWMNKVYLPKLPMAAFPHIRQICNAGFILDKNGNNVYLIHPERMALPTLYISGGRPILLTPETSFLANKYMKLHQPGYRHERVVVDGFGHSDLLIGEKSSEMVFCHIVRHIELVEEERSCLVSRREEECCKEALEWSDDLYEEGGSFGSQLFILIAVLLVVGMFKLFLEFPRSKKLIRAYRRNH